MSVTPEPREWTVNVAVPDDADLSKTGAPEDHALARLRDTIRDDGYVIDIMTVRQVMPQRVRLDENGVVVEGEPNATVTQWSATATERATEDPPLLPDESDDPTAPLRFSVPDAKQVTGGGVGLKHDLDDEVTVFAFGDDGAKVGYVLATELDSNNVHVELFPGTVLLTVTRDSDVTPDSGVTPDAEPAEPESDA